MDHNFTPLDVVIVLHHHCHPYKYAADNPSHRDSHAVTYSHNKLLRMNILRTNDSLDSGYEVTEKGSCLIHHWLCSPEPVQTWSMPNVQS